MGQRCRICSDERRLKIDRDLVRDGSNVTRIAQRYSVPYHSLLRHQKKHLSRQLLVAHQQKELVDSTDLANELTDLFSRAKSILSKAEAEDRLGLALKAISEGRNTLESVFKIAAFIFDSQREQDEQEKADQLDKLKKLPTYELEELQRILGRANGDHDRIIDIDDWDDDEFEPEPKRKKRKPIKLRERIPLDDIEDDDDNIDEDDDLEQVDYIPRHSVANGHLLSIQRGIRRDERRKPRVPEFLRDAVKGSVKFRTLT
jgi:transposase-like protein